MSTTSRLTVDRRRATKPIRCRLCRACAAGIRTSWLARMWKLLLMEEASLKLLAHWSKQCRCWFPLDQPAIGAATELCRLLRSNRIRSDRRRIRDPQMQSEAHPIHTRTHTRQDKMNQKLQQVAAIQVVAKEKRTTSTTPTTTARSKGPNHTSFLLKADSPPSKPPRSSTMFSRIRGRTQGLFTIVSIVSSLMVASNSRLAGAQCPVHTMTSFERISGVTVNPNLLTVLYTAPNVSQPINPAIQHLLSSGGLERHSSQMSMPIPITAECNNRCRRSSRCRAFLVDYARHTCYSIDSNQTPSQGLMRQPTPITLLPTQDRTSYFEKICLNLPAIDCERAWIYERVLSHQLYGHDDKIIDDVPSRLRCQEHCLNEREFRCRSGEYDYVQQQCRLSMIDRHVKPNAFRPSSASVDYFENQCVSVGNQCDAFDRFEDLDLGRAEIMRSANTSDQCQLFCTQTIKAFVCRSFTWNPITGKCYLNSANTFTVGGLDKLISAPGLIYYQRNDCIDLKLECDTSAMTLQLRTNEPFRGRMYVRDEPNLCETLGRSSLSSSLSIPFNHHASSGDGLSASGRSCATRELPSRYSSVVVVQQHPLIQRKSDRYIKVVCDFQTANKTISSSYNVVANPWTSTALINATSFAPKIRLRITDRVGNDITGAKLGDELFLRIEAETESVYDMVARSVLAKSGTSEESIALIDKDGCPTDFRIFPPLKKLNRRTIVGKFDAFKFSSDVVVRFQVDVQFCLNQCPPPICDQLSQQQQLLNAPPQLPSPADLGGGGGVENYSAGSLRPTTTLSPSSQESQMPSTQQPTTLAASGTSTTTTPSSIGQTINDDSSLVSVLQQASSAATVPSLSAASTTSSSSYPLLESGLRMPANMLGQFYSPTESHKQHSNGHQPSNGGGSNSNSNNYPVSANQLQTLMGQSSQLGVGDSQQTTVTSDPQIFESAARAKSDNSQQQVHHHQTTTNNNNNKRQRRSVEPIPTSPRHVPLQREIIVESSGNSNKGATADQKQQESKSTEGRSARTKTTSKSTTLTSNSIDFVAPSSSSKANGLTRNGPAYDTFSGAAAGNKLDFNDNRPLLDQDSRQSESDDSSLLCTTKQSLVLASLAFCAIQLLSLGLCLVTWLHKRRDGMFKVRQQQQQQQQQHQQRPFQHHQQSQHHQNHNHNHNQRFF